MFAFPLTSPNDFCFHSDEFAIAEYNAPCSKGKKFTLPLACPSNLLHKIMDKYYS